MGMKTNTSNILFTKVQQSVLKLLYLNTDCDYFTNEIIRLTESGVGAVQRELKKLTDAGLIIVKQVGNQKRYQANRDLPYFLELRSIIIKTFGLTEVLRNELELLLPDQLKLAFIYGSFSKQTDAATSDIDLMLIGDDLTYAEIFKLIENAEKILNRKISPTFYTPQEWIRKRKEGSHFINQVIEQPKIFVIGTEDELKKLR